MPQVFCFDLYNHFEVSKKIHEQVNWDESKKIKLWREIIRTKIENQNNLILNFYNEMEVCEKIQNHLNKLDTCESLNEISSIEAVCARIYFKKIFNDDFKRTDENIINAGLNYGYSLLRAYISIIVASKGLHPSLGICHKSVFNSFNLSDDIIELFRPMVDYAVYNKHKEVEVFTHDYRRHLLNIMCQDIIFNNQQMSLKRAIEMFIDSIINFFDGEDLIVPKLDVNVYEY
jgi:CRISPR-associated protein Cas1